MRLRGYPPEGGLSSPYVGNPGGKVVGSADDRSSVVRVPADSGSGLYSTPPRN